MPSVAERARAAATAMDSAALLTARTVRVGATVAPSTWWHGRAEGAPCRSWRRTRAAQTQNVR